MTTTSFSTTGVIPIPFGGPPIDEDLKSQITCPSLTNWFYFFYLTGLFCLKIGGTES